MAAGVVALVVAKLAAVVVAVAAKQVVVDHAVKGVQGAKPSAGGAEGTLPAFRYRFFRSGVQGQGPWRGFRGVP